MIQRVLPIVAIAAIASAAAAQAPEGWKVRIDRSQSAQDPDDTPELKVMRMGTGFHVVGGPAGTFWRPAETATGTYRVTASFTLMRPSGHVNYYGLIFGGRNLEGPEQQYGYFLIAQNGTFLVRQRNGDRVETIQARTSHDAIRQPDEDGRSTNTLEVRVDGNTIAYVVNGTVVHTTSRTGALAQTDGHAGVRINHMLDVHVEGFEVQS
jgi:hypothetical protein